MRKRFLHTPKGPVDSAGTKRITGVEKLNQILCDQEWHTTRELARRVGHKFGSSVFLLRRTGVEIVSEPAGRRQWRYRLLP